MLTFSVNEVDTLQMLRVEKAISDNINYFKKFNGFRWEEAVNKTFMTAVQHAKSEYESLDPYIKNLARNILKEQEKEIKALRLLVELAEECDFGFDQFQDEYERYKDELENMKYIDEMIYVAKRMLEDREMVKCNDKD